jgi:hypothetical protein
MSSVTFSTSVGGDGSTVTDDNNATTGLREGGWKTRFVPCFTQQVAVANFIVTKAGEAATSATAATTNGAAQVSLATAQVALATAQVALATTQANNAAASYDSFDDRYLGAKSSDPTLDNDGNALLTGALYWNSSTSVMKVWSGSAWVSYNPAISYLPTAGGTMTGAITFAAGQFGTNVNTFLSTPSSANLAAALTDETGTGVNVFNNTPTLITPILGTPQSGNLANCTFPTLNQNTSGTAAGLSATLAIASGGTNSIATPTAGGAGYGTGTAHAYTAAGTAGQVLTSAGAGAPIWQAPSSGALVFISSQTVSSAVSSVNFTSGMSSTYDDYIVHYKDVTMTGYAGSVGLELRLYKSGAFQTSLYIDSEVFFKKATTYAGSTNSGQIPLSDLGVVTATPLTGYFKLMNANSALANKVTVLGMSFNTSYGLCGSLSMCSGTQGTAAITTGFQIYFAAGSISAGTFILYGVAKS